MVKLIVQDVIQLKFLAWYGWWSLDRSCVFQGHLTRNTYLEFLKHQLFGLLSVIPAPQQAKIAFQHHGDSAHSLNAVSDFITILHGLVVRGRFLRHLNHQIYCNTCGPNKRSPGIPSQTFKLNRVWNDYKWITSDYKFPFIRGSCWANYVNFTCHPE